MNLRREPWLNPTRAVTAYATIFSIFIAWASLRTALSSAQRVPVFCLASVEVAGSVLFALRKTRSIGLVILLVVFAIAAVVELHLGEWPIRFVFYAATALFAQYHSVEVDTTSS